MPIRVLPPDVAAKIAAGEVVERPASVVKELVENALDAGATRIAVELRGGGRDIIRVTDNGCGVPAGDVPSLLQRHATSKLASEDDLEGISTLGFRGEALHSIAAVARLSILTRPADSPNGVLVESETGKPPRLEPSGAPPGTTISVQRLFANVPARHKFLRSPQAENARVHSVLALYLLAYPEVAFSLTVDGRETLASPGNGQLREAAAVVHGAELAARLVAVESQVALQPDGDALRAVTGLVSPPDITRANRSGITIFVNRRPVQHRGLAVAVEQAYQGLLPHGRYPVAVLTVSIPYQEVDVNVHPAKTEVRFRGEGAVFGLVQRAVRAALLEWAPVAAIQMERAPSAPPGLRLEAQPHQPSLLSGNAAALPGDNAFQPPRLQPDRSLTRTSAAVERLPTLQSTPHATQPPKSVLPVLRVLGQTQETYVVAEGPAGVYLIDQHAAHERVQYERLMESVRNSAPDAQLLLTPEVVSISPQQQETLAESMSVLARCGWDLEAFGDRSVLVRAMPALLIGKGPAPALRDLLDAAAAERAMQTLEERLLATMACHGSVRAGQTLSLTEMGELVRQLYECAAPNTCPHGRPTLIHLSAAQLEREFQRR
jgi:DNA mismatch repair protein MutL